MAANVTALRVSETGAGSARATRSVVTMADVRANSGANAQHVTIHVPNRPP